MKRRWTAVAIVVSLGAAAAACGDDDVNRSQRREERQAETQPLDEVREEMGGTTAEELPYQEVIDRSIADIEAWYDDELPAGYGVEYTHLDVIEPYTSESTDFGACFEGATYDDTAGNAFYCTLDGAIRYDNEILFPQLYENFGPFVISVVLAHEWGHAIQDQTGFFDQETVLLETQADCHAGAWADHIDAGESSEGLELAPGDLESAVAGMIEFRDPPGSNPNEAGAHGSGFDRVAAFQRGFELGLDGCADWKTNPPDITEIPFQSDEDIANEGNLPLDELLPLVLTDFDVFWGEVFSGIGEQYESLNDVVSYDSESEDAPDCDGESPEPRVHYCAADDTVRFDVALFDVILSEIGDGGVTVLLSNAWAAAMQERLGVSGDQESLGLQQDCLSGAWHGSVFDGRHRDAYPNSDDPNTSFLILSPGDLDEVVLTFLAFSSEEGAAVTGFQRVSAFRLGFFSDSTAGCDAIAGG
jgi:predicted metalloprotease